MGVLGTILKVATLPIKWVAGLVNDAVKANKENKKQEEDLRTKEALDNIQDTNDKKGTESISNQNEKIKASRRKLTEAQREYESAQKSIQTQKAQLTREINAENTDEYMNEAKIAFNSNSDSEGSPQESYKSFGEGINSAQNSSRGFRGIFRSYYGYDPEGNRVKLHGKLRAEARRKANLDAKKQRNLEKLEKLKQKEFEIENRKSFATFGLLGRIQENQYYRNQLAQAKLETDDKVRNASIKALKKQHREEKAARRRKLAGLLALGITPFLLSSTLRNGLKEFTETSTLGKGLKSIWDGATNLLKSGWEWFKDTTLGKPIVTFVDNLKDRLGWDTNKTLIENVWDRATDFFSGAADRLQNFMSSIPLVQGNENYQSIINNSDDKDGKGDFLKTIINSISVLISGGLGALSKRLFGEEVAEKFGLTTLNSSEATGLAVGDVFGDLAKLIISLMMGEDSRQAVKELSEPGKDFTLGNLIGGLISDRIKGLAEELFGPELSKELGFEPTTSLAGGLRQLSTYAVCKLLGIDTEKELEKYGINSAYGSPLEAVLSYVWNDSIRPFLLNTFAVPIYELVRKADILDLIEKNLDLETYTRPQLERIATEGLMPNGDYATFGDIYWAKEILNNPEKYGTREVAQVTAQDFSNQSQQASTIVDDFRKELLKEANYSSEVSGQIIDGLFGKPNSDREASYSEWKDFINSISNPAILGLIRILTGGGNEIRDTINVLESISNDLSLNERSLLSDLTKVMEQGKDPIGLSKAIASQVLGIYSLLDTASYFKGIPKSERGSIIEHAVGINTDLSDGKSGILSKNFVPKSGYLLYTAAQRGNPEITQASFDAGITEQLITRNDMPNPYEVMTRIRANGVNTNQNNLLIGQPMLLPAVNTVTEKDRFVFTFKQTNDYAVGN